MKKAFLILLILVPMLAGAVDFDEVVDFSIELADISEKAVADNVAADGRVIILEGITGDYFTVGDTRWLRLIGGEWVGTDEVLSYTCVFPVGDNAVGEENDAAGGAVPGLPEPGSRLLVSARLTGWDARGGEPVGEILEFRILR